MKQHNISIVTGAPGSGKSSLIDLLLKMNTRFLIFDMDWMVEHCSQLTGKDIYIDQSSWKPYNALWFEIMHSISRNGQVPVLFAPIDPKDVNEMGIPAWCNKVNWLLLDCSDEERSKRLSKRSDWGQDRNNEALADAASLRNQINSVVLTDDKSLDVVAKEILDWLESH